MDVSQTATAEGGFDPGGGGWLGLLWSMWRGLFLVYIVLALGLAAVVGQRQVSWPRGIL